MDMKERVLQELSISRLYQKFSGGAVDSFAVLSACHSTADAAANNRDTESLRGDLAGWGYSLLAGYWQGVREYSFWIDNISFNDALHLCSKYDQTAFIYAGPESGGKVTEFSQSGSPSRVFTTFHPDDLTDAYSRWRNRPFRFEEGHWNWVGAMGVNSTRHRVNRFVDAHDGKLTQAEITEFVVSLLSEVENW